MNKKVALIVLDGFGLSAEEKGNAVLQAKTPNYDKLIKNYKHTAITAHGEAVGLLKGKMGNSEVGHLNLGAGQIVNQASKYISDQIKDKDFFNNKELLNAVNTNGNVHLMGLLSTGGVHSSLKHLFALLELCKQRNKKDVYIHLFTDGRDSDPYESINYIKKLNKKIKELGVGKIASVAGRYWAMDRDKNYDRVKKVYDMLVFGNANKSTDILNAINNSHKENITDEFIEPTLIENLIEKAPVITENDSVIFYNFRGDRARQLTNAFVNKNFEHFETKRFKSLNFVVFINYDRKIKNLKAAFTLPALNNTLGQVIANNKRTQLRVAETTKYAHVTYFFNGGIEKPNKNEDRLLVPTKKVKTFDLLPEMSAKEITDSVIDYVDKTKYDFVLINFANCDMVGHTGNLKAAIKAVEAVDKNLGKLIKYFDSQNYSVMVTADHGNAENMLSKDGKIITAHSLNKVPFVLVSDELKNITLKTNGKLSNVGATVLNVMGIEVPDEYEPSLITKF